MTTQTLLAIRLANREIARAVRQGLLAEDRPERKRYAAQARTAQRLREGLRGGTVDARSARATLLALPL